MFELIAQYPFFAALLALVSLALAFGAILGFAAVRFKIEGNPIVDQIDSLLPQTQCGQCGHPGCRPYAEAIADGDAINKCPPGGESTIQNLADLLGVEPEPLDAEEGAGEVKRVAFVIEEDCIGCTKCVQACPMDAILGAARHTHTIIEADCTGCDLCLEPCPVDCIEMRPIQTTMQTWSWNLPEPSKERVGKMIASDRRGTTV